MTTSLRELPAKWRKRAECADKLGNPMRAMTLIEAADQLESALSTPPAEGTPSSRWSANGEPDPHGDRYACERAALAMGDMTDDELANAVFLHGDTKPSMADLISGKAILPSAYLTAAKDRIRWLSRQLDAAMIAATEGSNADQ